MADLTLYSVKQDRLTTSEIDNNFTALNDELVAATTDLNEAASVATPGALLRRDSNGGASLSALVATTASMTTANVVNLNVSGTQTINNLVTTGSVSATNGTFTGTVSATALTGIGRGFSEMTVLTAGTGTFTVPANVTRLKFTIVGGGGGGGGTAATANTAGGGGGSGAFLRHIVTVTPGQTLTYTVGAGGVGNSAAAGTAGASSTITIAGVTFTAGGGGAGTTTTGGAGGTATGAAILVSNGQQGGGGSTAALSGGAASSGANSFMGFGIGGNPQNDATGANGVGFGAGGSGAVTTAATARAGGSGAPGVLIIEY